MGEHFSQYVREEGKEKGWDDVEGGGGNDCCSPEEDLTLRQRDQGAAQGVQEDLPARSGNQFTLFQPIFAWNPGFNNLCYDHYDLILSIFPDDKETISGKLR